MKTIVELVQAVHRGLADDPDAPDVSPSDVGRIVGTFLVLFAQTGPKTPADAWLEKIGRECLTVKDK